MRAAPAPFSTNYQYSKIPCTYLDSTGRVTYTTGIVTGDNMETRDIPPEVLERLRKQSEAWRGRNPEVPK